ncbi:MAG: HD domain-containing protein [Oscillospiraceae bacterium]|nr:HD domain-containing protein [Oscillospiraceae bacterium]
MEYREAREYIQKASVYGIVPGLSNIKRLCGYLGNPQEELRVIHIAGTNGKGSTGAFIEAILRAAGIRTGRFSTPAVFDYSEQFQVNGENISPARYAHYIDLIKTASEQITEEGYPHPTPFEMETALAFMYFRDEDCGAAVIEAGMGGGMDATNVISKSIASVITPIGMDHMRFLGDTKEEIALHKAGIIKENGIVITAPQADCVMRVIEREAARNNAKLFISDRDIDYEISLKGEYQRTNAALAAEVCRRVGFNITEREIEYGLKNTVWHGRFEKICEEPELIIDGAHNEHGARALMKSIDRYYRGRKIIYIMGVLCDKEYKKIAELTAHRADKIYTITPPRPRGLKNETLAAAVGEFNKNVEAVTLDAALKLCFKEKDAVIAAFGSLSFLGELVGKVRNILSMRKCNNILNNEKFKKLMKQLEDAERDRIYCKHDITHLMDVARAGYIINLENDLGIPKEIIYGAALIHDIGRVAQYTDGIHHHEAGAKIAEEILPQCGYTEEETKLIAQAVREHRSIPERAETLGDIIAAADKQTRMCMLCGEYDTCKWEEREKNTNLTV